MSLIAIDIGRSVRESPLGRTSPLVKLGLALAWLIGLATTTEPLPPLVLAAIAVTAALFLGRVPPRRLIRGIAPLLLAAVSISVATLLFSASNGLPGAETVVRLGPIRITAEAVASAAAIGLRVVAIVVIGAAFAQTTDPTSLVDGLVQQARLSDRFGYGALAAYQAAPRLAQDLETIRGARRSRGLGGGWHPRILIGLLVRAIRHADQQAVAMDARGFGSGPRTFYRPLRWSPRDALVGLVGLVTAVAVLLAWG